MKLSVIMPAFNEVASLDETIKQCDSLAATMPIEVEVIIVDDGSTDGSNELLKSAVQDRPWLRILMHTSNQGYGVALRTGFLAARGELVFYTDADNQFDLLEVPEAVSRIGTADMLVGFRVYRFDPLSRLVVSWVYNRLVRLLFRIRVRDVDCSFKLIRRETRSANASIDGLLHRHRTRCPRPKVELEHYRNWRPSLSASIGHDNGATG